MKKDVKSDLKVKNWQESNWYEPSEERCKYLDIPGIPQRIWVTEEFYKTYKRDFWNEWKGKLLGSRCRIKSEKGNFWKRCDGDCSICPHSKTGNTLSLDQFFDDTELEFPDESVDIVRDICIEERNNTLWKAVAELDETDQLIIKGFSQGVSDSKLAKQLGISQPAVHKRRMKSIAILKEKLGNIDLWL